MANFPNYFSSITEWAFLAKLPDDLVFSFKNQTSDSFSIVAIAIYVKDCGTFTQLNELCQKGTKNL